MNPFSPINWFNFSFLCFIFIFPIKVTAVDTFPLDQDHRGLINLLENNNTGSQYCKYCSGTYQIFPENRMGNGLYFQKKLLVTFPNRVILDLYEIPDAESLVYLYEEDDQNLAIGLHDFSGEDRSKIKRVDDEFYEVWAFSIGIRSIFRIYQNRLERVASHLRTVTGVTPSRSHVAYYHIAKSEIIEEDGKEVRIYEFSIHILKRSAALPRRLNVKVQDKRSILKLSWVNENTLRYQLSDGTFRDIDAAALLPDYF
ncbi:MAG: hypothetical protein HQM13_08925 [SAR324 cluster bacterium]|nr:hypothetical protein [SAR324 cluster bacterium]